MPSKQDIYSWIRAPDKEKTFHYVIVQDFHWFVLENSLAFNKRPLKCQIASLHRCDLTLSFRFPHRFTISPSVEFTPLFFTSLHFASSLERFVLSLLWVRFCVLWFLCSLPRQFHPPIRHFCNPDPNDFRFYHRFSHTPPIVNYHPSPLPPILFFTWYINNWFPLLN